MKNRLIRLAVRLGAAFTVGSFLLIVGYVLIRGLTNLSPGLFSLKYTSDNVSMLPSIINTVLITVLSLLIAAPLSVMAAIYLVEYARRGSKLVKLIRITTETLSGIPSIVYGLFGMLLFVNFLGWGYSLIAGAVTLSIMITPLIMRSTEEALIAVPDSFREGSLGLGANRLRTVFKVVLPSAMPGVLSGIVLAIGRITGESAALLYTAGTATRFTGSVLDSGRTLSVHMYVLSGEGLHIDEAYAVGAVLLAIVFLMNAASALIAKRLTGVRNG